MLPLEQRCQGGLAPLMGKDEDTEDRGPILGLSSVTRRQDVDPLGAARWSLCSRPPAQASKPAWSLQEPGSCVSAQTLR